MKKLIVSLMMLLIATNGYTITRQEFETKEAEFNADKKIYKNNLALDFDEATKSEVSKKSVLKIKELLPSVLEFQEKELKYLNFKIEFLKEIGDKNELEITESTKQGLAKIISSNRNWLDEFEFHLKKGKKADRDGYICLAILGFIFALCCIPFFVDGR